MSNYWLDSPDKLICKKAHIISVDEDSVLVFMGSCWRFLIEDFVEPPERNMTVIVVLDNLWKPEYVKVYPNES